MTAEAAFVAVAEAALASKGKDERLAVIDALAILAHLAGLSAWAAETTRVASAIRAADSMQLTFLKHLTSENPHPDGAQL